MYLKIVFRIASSAVVIVTSQGRLAQHQPCSTCKIQFITRTAHDFIASAH